MQLTLKSDGSNVTEQALDFTIINTNYVSLKRISTKPVVWAAH